MRGPLVLLALALLAIPLSGCIADDPPPGPETGQAWVEPVEEPSPPTPILVERPMGPSVDPMIFVDGSVCGAAAQCYAHPFVVASNASLEAFLSWSLDVNDLDLHLYRPDGSVTSSATLLPGNMESMRVDLEPGEHTLVVVGFLVTEETFTLDARFA